MKKNQPVSILVVDDDRTHRIMLKTMLKQWGWQVEEADDGTTAIEAAHRTPFDAILMDVRMTKLNGIEALRVIRGDRRSEKIPVIIVTSSTLESDRTAAFAAGADAFLHKAFDIDEYERQIRSQLVRWLQD